VQERPEMRSLSRAFRVSGKAITMGKHLLALAALAALCASDVLIAGQTPASAPATELATRPVELAAKLVLEIQEVAKIDAPGAEGFASVLAGVLKKHSLPVPEAILKAEPSAALPKLTEKQLENYSSQAVKNLLDHISDDRPGKVGAGEGALRIDLLEAFSRYAPRMELRLDAAYWLLKMALPGGEKGVQPSLMVDPHRAVEAARTAVTESLAAARDGRDSLSTRSRARLLLRRVTSRMIGIDLLNLKEPTRESLEKARKQWDEQFAALEKDALDEYSKEVLTSIRTYLSVPFTDAQVEAMLLPRKCMPIAEAFFQALEKRDREALKVLLTPTTAAKLLDKDLNALAKGMFGGTPRQIRLLSIGGLTTSGRDEGVSVPCNVIWVDEDGKEHTSRPEIHIVKTDKGWLVGEK